MNDDPAAMEEAMAAAAVLGAALARFQNALDRLRKPPEALSQYRKQHDPEGER